MLGVMNTNGKIASRATLAGITGTRSNDNWFRFTGNGKGLFHDSAVITFFFESGGSKQFKIRECKNGGQIHVFQWAIEIKTVDGFKFEFKKMYFASFVMRLNVVESK